MNEDGWRVGRPTENVVIRYNRTARGHGGAVFGSDMSGGIRNVYVHSCIYEGTDVGVRLKSTRGRGGVVEKLWFENIVMKDISRDAIQITTAYRAWMGTTEGKPPVFRNVTFRNIHVEDAARAIVVEGLPDAPIQSLRMEEVSISARKGISAKWLEGFDAQNVAIKEVPEPGAIQ